MSVWSPLMLPRVCGLKVAIITGGDSGIGRSVAIYFAKEGEPLYTPRVRRLQA